MHACSALAELAIHRAGNPSVQHLSWLGFLFKLRPFGFIAAANGPSVRSGMGAGNMGREISVDGLDHRVCRAVAPAIGEQ